MKRIKFINGHLNGFKIKILLLIVATILCATFALFADLVFSFVIDNVIGNSPINLMIIEFLSNILGGTKYIKEHLYLIVIILIIFYTVSSLFMVYRQRSQGIICENLVKNIRDHLYRHLQELPFEYHVKVKTGELIQKCTSDVDTIRRFFSGQFAEIFYIFSIAIIALIILFNINFKLALISAFSLPIIFIYSYTFFKRIQKEFLKSDEAEALMSDAIQESLSGIRVVKAFNREAYEIERLLKVNQNYYDVTYKMIKELGFYWTSSYIVCLLGILLIIILGVYSVRSNAISIGGLIVFITYQTKILYAFRNLGRILSDFGKVTVSIDRLIDILDTATENCEEGTMPIIDGNIEFKDVSFGYGDNCVLHHINLKILKGQTVAIMGPTGSGKSSLIHLLSRLYDVNDGVILIDGVNINDINKNYLRDNVSIVLQEPFLFSKTIMDNLRIVKPDASNEEIYNACRIANVHDVILSFDKDYDTLVGEKGATLSGGQKQRIAMARSILKANRIIVFDDSLSAVDTKTDALIKDALNKLDNITKIIITQRISSAKDCDLIYVIENGYITQSGTHNDLIIQDGLYKRIFDIQSNIDNFLEVPLHE